MISIAAQNLNGLNGNLVIRIVLYISNITAGGTLLQ